MDHFKGTDAAERYNNDLLNETKRTNILLEQLVQLLQPKIEQVVKVPISKKPQEEKS